MGNLSLYFDRAEFACKCGCGFDTVDVDLVDLLEEIRHKFDAPITINSGCRCPAYNEKVGGEKASKHMQGRAADIAVKGVPPASVADFAETLACGGVGRYATFTHIDSRTVEQQCRWNG